MQFECVCGSGKPFKECCAVNKEHKPFKKEVIGVKLDHVNNTKIMATNDMLINQLNRDCVAITETFDKLCINDFNLMSDLYSRTAFIIMVGNHNVIEINDRRREACSFLLLNAVQTFAGAVDLLRRGFRVPPGILVRNIIEIISTVLYISTVENGFKKYTGKNFRSTPTIKVANDILPFIWPFYKQLSNDFVHIGDHYKEPNLIHPYNDYEEPLVVNLLNLKFTLWLLYATTELVFLDVVSEPRYWKFEGQYKYKYHPSREEILWQKEYFGCDFEEILR